MTTAKEPSKPSEAKSGYVFMIVPPNVEAMITGVKWANCYNNGRIVLMYEDGSSDGAQFTLEESDNLASSSFFNLVSSVQSKVASGWKLT